MKSFHVIALLLLFPYKLKLYVLWALFILFQFWFTTVEVSSSMPGGFGPGSFCFAKRPKHEPLAMRIFWYFFSVEIIFIPPLFSIIYGFLILPNIVKWSFFLYILNTCGFEISLGSDFGCGTPSMMKLFSKFGFIPFWNFLYLFLNIFGSVLFSMLKLSFCEHISYFFTFNKIVWPSSDLFFGSI